MEEGQTADDATLIDASDLTIQIWAAWAEVCPVKMHGVKIHLAETCRAEMHRAEMHRVEICRMETPDNKEELLEKEKTVVYYNAMRKSTEREYEYGFRAMLQGTGGRLCRGHAQTPEGRAGTPFFDKILRKR